MGRKLTAFAVMVDAVANLAYGEKLTMIAIPGSVQPVAPISDGPTRTLVSYRP